MSMYSSNYEKHTCVNGIQRWLIDRFYEVLLRTVKDTGSSSVLDAGCGEGFTLDRCKKAGVGTTHTGFDVSRHAVQTGKKLFSHLSLTEDDIYHSAYPSRSFDLVICSEVLEHLADPAKALVELRRVSKRYILLTVPWEPWFQLANIVRGKYLRTWGNHPEHINHWTLGGFRAFLTRSGLHIHSARVVFPWTMVLATR